MKIALLGYGKMGQVIERIAKERGHEIVLKKSRNASFEGLEKADVAIDFSIPNAAVDNISTCLENGIPVISGTTGWLAHYPKMAQLCEDKNGAILYHEDCTIALPAVIRDRTPAPSAPTANSPARRPCRREPAN